MSSTSDENIPVRERGVTRLEVVIIAIVALLSVVAHLSSFDETVQAAGGRAEGLPERQGG